MAFQISSLKFRHTEPVLTALAEALGESRLVSRSPWNDIKATNSTSSFYTFFRNLFLTLRLLGKQDEVSTSEEKDNK